MIIIIVVIKMRITFQKSHSIVIIPIEREKKISSAKKQFES